MVDRGHTVFAAARTPENVQKLKNVSSVQDDLRNPAKTASIRQGRGRRRLGLWAAAGRSLRSKIVGLALSRSEYLFDLLSDVSVK
jgi:hypothetical protein